MNLVINKNHVINMKLVINKNRASAWRITPEEKGAPNYVCHTSDVSRSLPSISLEMITQHIEKSTTPTKNVGHECVLLTNPDSPRTDSRLLFFLLPLAGSTNCRALWQNESRWTKTLPIQAMPARLTGKTLHYFKYRNWAF